MSDLYSLAEAFCSAIHHAKYDARFSNKDRMYRFPNGCCDDSCDILGYHLLRRYGIHTKQVNGLYDDGVNENITNHAWLVSDDKQIIDITYGQFKFCAGVETDIYVGEENAFYLMLKDIRIYENYNIENCERLWNDYKVIIEYL